MNFFELMMAEQFARMFNIYINETSIRKDMILGCVQIINDDNSAQADVKSAVSKLAECLFPLE